MTDAENKKPDWQISLEHHEDLCTERYTAVYKEMQFLRDDMREMRMEMRSGQRWIIGILLAWPPLLITAMLAGLKWIT